MLGINDYRILVGQFSGWQMETKHCLLVAFGWVCIFDTRRISNRRGYRLFMLISSIVNYCAPIRLRQQRLMNAISKFLFWSHTRRLH